MGTPTEEAWPGVSKLPKYKTLLGGSSHHRHPLRHHHQHTRSASARRDAATASRSRGGCGSSLWHPGKPLSRVVPRLALIAHATPLAASLLQMPPDRRITARAAMRHPYFTVSLPTAQLACLPDSESLELLRGKMRGNFVYSPVAYTYIDGDDLGP